MPFKSLYDLCSAYLCSLNAFEFPRYAMLFMPPDSLLNFQNAAHMLFFLGLRAVWVPIQGASSAPWCNTLYLFTCASSLLKL